MCAFAARQRAVYAAALAAVIRLCLGIELDSGLHGWRGELERYEPVDGGGAGEYRRLEVLSWPHRVFHIHNLLTPEECDHLINRAKPRLARSSVVDAKGGGGTVSDIRTSRGMFFGRGETPVISRIEERIAQWVMVDAGQAEGFQILDYKFGQKYDPHFDYFFHESGSDNGGNRLLTILIYLSDVEEGGETVFPNIPAPPHQTHAEYSDCGMKGLAVKPKKGNAAVFWSLTTAGELNRGSLHGSCPVIKGEKFSATKWYHVAHYAMGREKAERVEFKVFTPPPPPAPEGCVDDDDHACKEWAKAGECDANPLYMVGSRARPGHCLLSCQRCDLMEFKAVSK